MKNVMNQIESKQTLDQHLKWREEKKKQFVFLILFYSLNVNKMLD